MLSHAARLELIRFVFSAIHVYYMDKILFTKKFLAKLTAVIRNFWWTGVTENDSSRSLCLRAWKDICNSKKEGGLDTPSSPKSAFWISVLKMMPKLKAHSFYQLTQGNISIWSSPWCTLWTSIHDYLNN
uniref:Reverse transcriptase zinc-binding domain-containing protein n=1 Tax=Triticum urartu TaxID=4572 RepID=A0A8R7K204_TRIUA